MQCKKSHIPLGPRTATYSCSVANRSPRKKTISAQTDKTPPSFQNFFKSNHIFKDDVSFNEEIKRYTTALEYINNFHSYMNRKLKEKYCESGDTKPEGNQFFKLPEVPNYATVFLMMLDKIKEPKLSTNKTIKKKYDGIKTVMEPKKYNTKESVIEFIPEIKELADYQMLHQNGALEEVKLSEREVQTIVSHLQEDGSISDPSKLLSDDFTRSSSKKSSNIQSIPSEEAQSLEIDTKSTVEKSCNCLLNVQVQKETADKETESTDLFMGQSNETQTSNSKLIPKSDISSDDRILMMSIIKKRVEEEITTYLDHSNSHAIKKEDTPKLVKSHFHVVTIQPQLNLLDYAQKKLERQLASEPKIPPPAGNQLSQNQFLSCCVSMRKSVNIRPNTPKKVTNMFRRFSQENFMGSENASRSNQSDGDSVILDDEEFEKINGYMEEPGEKNHKRNSSEGREKSNPLKLTVRDMTKVDEKMLSAIGLFTERGDVRPGVIDILEEQKKLKAKDTRNKQFRGRRQWDLQIHLNPKEEIGSSFSSVSTKSYISLSSTDLRSDIETLKNVCR